MNTSAGAVPLAPGLTTHARTMAGSAPTQEPTQHAFSPYDFNGGTVIAVGGQGFVVVAADTRLSTGYSILSRNVTNRIERVSEKCYLAAGGCHADIQQLFKVIRFRALMYRHDHGAEMSAVATAQLLSNTLYRKRFFPFYSLCVVAGVDGEGVGYVAGYDAVGSYIRCRENYTCNGSGASVVMPVLDNTFGSIGVSSGRMPKPQYTKAEIVEIVKTAFCGAR